MKVTKLRARKKRVLVLFDAGFASVVEKHRPGHALSSSAAVLGDAEPLAAALRAEGYDAVARGAALDPSQLTSTIRRARPEVVVNLCDTLGGEGAHAPLVPALLGAMGLPYAGATAAGLALSRRKHDVKAVLSRDGLPTPRFQVLASPDDLDAFRLHLEPPVIVKLTGEHASVGLEQRSVCVTVDDVKARARELWQRFPQPLLLEEYVGGKELSVSFVGDPPGAFDPMEHPFDDLPPGYLPLRTFDTKWTNEPGLSGERPRPLPPVPRRAPSVPGGFTLDGLTEAARRAFLATGCRDWGRVDVRLDQGGVPLIIDVTPNTYLGASAPCVKAAAQRGWSLGRLGVAIAESALRRGMSVAAQPRRRVRLSKKPRR